MKNRRKLQELTIKDNFMFGAVMLEERHCKRLLEMLLSGAEYAELPNSYVIFICDFDPFGEGKYRYSIENCCKELNGKVVEDGNHTIFFSTKGTNDDEVSPEMVKFLKFVGADLEKSKVDYEDEFVKNLQETIAHVKSSREMEERFMVLELLIKEERKAAREEGHAEGHAEGLAKGYAESVLEVLGEVGNVTDELRGKIMGENEVSTLKRWLKLATKAESIEHFESQM